MNKSIGVGCGLAVVLVGAAIAACTGDAGPAGPAGASGEAGAPGATGPAGAVGATGPSGGSGSGGNTEAGAGEGGAPSTGFTLSSRAQKGLSISPVPVNLAGATNAQAEQIGQGSYLVNAVGDCNGCHVGPKGAFLGGGTPFAIDNGAIVYARNLTPDATGLKLTLASFIETIRTGKDFNDPTHDLLVMPWVHFRWMTAADLGALYAYLHAIPGVKNAVPADTKNGSALLGAPVPFPGTYNEGDAVRVLPPDMDATGNPIADADVQRGIAIRPMNYPANLEQLPVDQQTSIGRGAYLVNAATCGDCHSNSERNPIPNTPGYLKIDTTKYLTGGQTFAVPPALQPVLHQTLSMSKNLVGATNGFLNESQDSLGRFFAVITSGTHADESVDGEASRPLGWPMPWQAFSQMETADLADVYAYLKTLPKNSTNDKFTQDYDRYCTAVGDCIGAIGETCDPTTHQCTGGTCTDATHFTDCGACQTCTSSKCALPVTTSTCPARGI